MVIIIKYLSWNACELIVTKIQDNQTQLFGLIQLLGYFS